jgi:hypothetical protein
METIHTPQTTLAEVKEYLTQNYEKGCICPACKQHVKQYKRKLSSTMAGVLIRIYAYLNKNQICNGFMKYQNILDQLQVPTSQRADWQKLVYFDLIEPKTTKKGDKEQGLYRITPRGIAFIKGEITMPEHCKVYNGKVRGYAMEQITIKQALKNRFDFDDLMNN